MKSRLFVLQVLLFAIFSFFLFLSMTEIAKLNSPFAKFNHEVPSYNGKEEFDPSLARLNTMQKLETYCDSLYNARLANPSVGGPGPRDNYPELTSAVIRERFYHGYSCYDFTNNYMALLLEPFFPNKMVSAIVVTEDMMKYSYAACSQQSIICMELLAKKGYSTRRIGFDGGEKYGGHFSFEVYYGGQWHFFDPNKEPDMAVLDKYNQPGIEFLAQQDDILLAAYRKLPSNNVLALYKNYSYGRPNVFEANNALLYQRATKILSYIFWVFPFIALLFVRKRYLRLSHSTHVWNNRIYIPKFGRKGSPAYYPESETQGA